MTDHKTLIGELRAAAAECLYDTADLCRRAADALVAAAGAAPQEPRACDCGAGPGSAVCKKSCASRSVGVTPVQVDEAKLAEVIRPYYPDTPLDAARAVAEWLRGGGR